MIFNNHDTLDNLDKKLFCRTYVCFIRILGLQFYNRFVALIMSSQHPFLFNSQSRLLNIRLSHGFNAYRLSPNNPASYLIRRLDATSIAAAFNTKRCVQK